MVIFLPKTIVIVMWRNHAMYKLRHIITNIITKKYCDANQTTSSEGKSLSQIRHSRLMRFTSLYCSPD